MIKLINGRGQLGSGLGYLNEDILIYHTWNISDKSQKTQRKEYLKFIKFVELNKDSKIIFISTSSTKDNWYNFYKLKSEAYLITNTAAGVVIKLPTLIGKGIFEKLKNNEAVPSGNFNLSTIDEALKFIQRCAFEETIVRTHILQGEKVSAAVVHSLIKFGQK